MNPEHPSRKLLQYPPISLDLDRREVRIYWANRGYGGVDQLTRSINS